jgi:CheY-specific phosphatase CheX
MADIPVIVISSEHCPPGSLALSWASGYVRKPFTPEALRAAIDGLTAQKKGTDVDAHWLLERFDYVLQTLTFMCADRLAEGDQAIAPDRSIVASMEFSGSVNGSIWIAVSTGLAGDMARNALGDDELEIGDHQAADVVGEVLNVTCGLVTDALSRGVPTEMTPPTLSELDAQGWDELLLQPIATTCLVEDRPLLVALAYTAKRD